MKGFSVHRHRKGLGLELENRVFSSSARMVNRVVVTSRILRTRLYRPVTPFTYLQYSTVPPKPTLGSATPYAHSKPPPPPKTWLATKLKQNPTALRAFLGFTKLLGYGSKKQIAGRRAFLLYERLCAARPDEEREFWQGGKSIFIFLIAFFTTIVFDYGGERFGCVLTASAQNVTLPQHSSLGLLLRTYTSGCSPSAYEPFLNRTLKIIYKA